MGGDHHSLWCSHHHSYNSYTEKHLWQASIDEYYSVVFSTALSHSKCCSTELPFRLAHFLLHMLTYQESIHQHCM